MSQGEGKEWLWRVVGDIYTYRGENGWGCAFTDLYGPIRAYTRLYEPIRAFIRAYTRGKNQVDNTPGNNTKTKGVEGGALRGGEEMTTVCVFFSVCFTQGLKLRQSPCRLKPFHIVAQG